MKEKKGEKQVKTIYENFYNKNKFTEILDKKGEEQPSSSATPLFPSPFSKIFRLRAKSDVNCNKRERIYKEENK